jgi:hypothetical protein
MLVAPVHVDGGHQAVLFIRSARLDRASTQINLIEPASAIQDLAWGDDPVGVEHNN